MLTHACFNILKAFAFLYLQQYSWYIIEMLKKALIFCLLLITVLSSKAQRCSVDQLISMLDWTATRFDTTLKKEGYILMKKDIDSSSSLYEYSYLDVKEKKPATLRSLVYMDVKAGQLKSRLITYRTYNKEEYLDINSYLLAHDYKATEKYDFGESKHTVYNNGSQSIRVKVTTTVLKDGKKFVMYELELGK